MKPIIIKITYLLFYFQKDLNLRYYPHILASLYCVFFLLLSIDPVDRTVWIAEMIPVGIIFLLLVFTYSKFQFSNIAYTLMSFWLVFHTIGGYYTFANVPFSFITELFDFQRNHFDRMAHFSIGLYAYAMAEFVYRKNYMSKTLAMIFGLLFIISLAGVYEIIEWIYAVTDGGEAGIEFLGSQGDVWDAQKDILSDTLGAITSLILFKFVHKNK